MTEQKTAIPQRMVGYKVIQGIIKVETGLHIGGNSDTIEIGGMDNPIIRNPVNKEPFIPGSSLKGKMRSLLEWKLGKLENEDPRSNTFGKPYGYHPKNQDDVKQGHPISRIFGNTDEDALLGPTRLIVRDAAIAKSYREEMARKNWTYNDLVEEKYENTINRITACANPRPLQRVVTGAKFDFEIIYWIMDLEDNGEVDRNLFQYVLDALKLVEMDALGGSGSRGCGKVSFHMKLNDEWKTLDEVKATDFEETSI